ncbi:MAG: transcription termination/antitermination NusG family protein [Pseudomonadota bacterium]
MNTVDMSETIWHVIRTQVRMEFAVAYYLGRRNFRAFAPFCFVQTKHARKVTEVRRPVFVRYVMVGRSAKRDINDALLCPGVSGLVRFRDEPAIVPNKIMAALMDDCDGDGWMKSKDDHPALKWFKPEQKVKINSGPLEGFIAQINALDDDGRLSVRVQMFGATRSISVPSATVEALEPTP